MLLAGCTSPIAGEWAGIEQEVTSDGEAYVDDLFVSDRGEDAIARMFSVETVEADNGHVRTAIVDHEFVGTVDRLDGSYVFAFVCHEGSQCAGAETMSCQLDVDELHCTIAPDEGVGDANHVLVWVRPQSEDTP